MGSDNNQNKNLTRRDEFGRFVKGMVSPNKGVYKIPREIILCRCGCGEKLLNYNKWKKKVYYKRGHSTPKIRRRPVLCVCGCGGLLITPGRKGKRPRYIRGHHNRKKRDILYGYNIFPKLIRMVKCACPCGEWMRFVINKRGIIQKYKLGHNSLISGWTPWNTGKKLTYEQKRNYFGLKRGLGHIVSEEARKRIGLAATGRKASREARMKMSLAHSKIITPKRDTSIEKKMQKALTDLGISFDKHKVFKIRDKYHPVDLFIKPNICVECDGDYYHSMLFNIARDYIIDYELEKQNMVVIRLWEYDINNNFEWCIDQITRRL